MFAPRLSPFGDLEPLLDALTPPLLGERLTYRESIARFNSEPQLFLPSAAALSAPGPSPAAAPDAVALSLKAVAARTVIGRVKRRILRRSQRRQGS